MTIINSRHKPGNQPTLQGGNICLSKKKDILANIFQYVVSYQSILANTYKADTDTDIQFADTEYIGQPIYLQSDKSVQPSVLNVYSSDKVNIIINSWSWSLESIFPSKDYANQQYTIA